MEGGDLISWAAIEGEKEKRGGEGAASCAAPKMQACRMAARQKLGRGAFSNFQYKYIFSVSMVIKEVKQIVLPRSHFHTCFPSWRSPLDLSYL